MNHDNDAYQEPTQEGRVMIVQNKEQNKVVYRLDDPPKSFAWKNIKHGVGFDNVFTHLEFR